MIRAEWWTPGLGPEAAVAAFTTSSITLVTIRILLDERLAGGELTEESLQKILSQMKGDGSNG